MLAHWSQLVPNMSTDIRGHEATPEEHEEEEEEEDIFNLHV